MRKQVLVFILTLACVASDIYAQSYPGYSTGNYTGVNGLFFNPANIANNRYKWDINIFAINGFVGTDQGGLSFGDITEGFNSDSLRSKLLKGHSQINSLNPVDILGPSFMLSLGPNTSVAFSTRTRVFSNAKDINGDLANAMINANNTGITTPINLNIGNTVTHATGWTEIGGSVAHVLSPEGSNHFFKGGITLKYLAGNADAYLTTNNISGTLANPNGSAVIAGPASGYLSVNATSENFKHYTISDFFKFEGHGFGGDIGFVYEWRPDLDYSRYVNDYYSNKYKIKIGISIMDIGSIKFDKSTNSAANYTFNIPKDSSFHLNTVSGKPIDKYIEVLDESHFFTAGTPQSSSYSVNLPTTIQANIDYLYNNNLGFNFAAQINASSSKNFNLYYFNSYSLTPRWENPLWSIELPLNYNDITKFNAGLAFRIGPLFVGSGSVITALFQNTKQADLHVGLHFGLQHKKKLKIDTDKDGVYDDVDKCIDVPGVARYKGCPIPDTDGDGINDEQDSCITLPGIPRFHGCPIPDTDGDGVNDEEDSCVFVPGPFLYHGCPDTDGDGIPDPEDKCPNVKGFAKYQGCPIPDTDSDGVNDEEDLCPTVPGPAATSGCHVDLVVNQITADFKNILFNVGKSTIRPESMAILVRAAKMMNEQIPNSEFYVDGFTDNKGRPSANKALSKARAESVARALIADGVNKDRIIARGFGSENPKCPNATEEGRQCNRRVELVIRNVNQ